MYDDSVHSGLITVSQFVPRIFLSEASTRTSCMASKAGESGTSTWTPSPSPQVEHGTREFVPGGTWDQLMAHTTYQGNIPQASTIPGHHSQQAQV